MSNNTLDHHDGGYSVSKWDSFEINTANYIIGKSGSGKTTLLESLYSRVIDQIDEVFVLTPHNDKYTNLTIKEHIYTDLNQLDQLFRYFVKNKKLNRVVIIDSFEGMGDLSSVKRLAMNHRSVNATVFFVSQYPCLPLMIRTNLDNVLICREQMKANQHRLYTHFCGIFSSFHVFSDVLAYTTKNFRCLVIDQRRDRYGWFEADLATRVNLPPKIVKAKLDDKCQSCVELPLEDLETLKSTLRQLKSLSSRLLDHFEKSN
jgi:hypothetical protein